MFAASCQKSEVVGSAPSGEQLVITAGLEDDGIIKIDGEETVPETKTVRNPDNTVWWTPGDAISVFYGSGTGGGTKFTSTLTSNNAYSDFSGYIGVVSGSGEGNIELKYFWGVYPYSTENSCNGSYVTLTVPTEQESAEGTFAPGQWPTVGKSRGLEMSFKNVACGYKFKVETSGITSVKITAKSGFLTGKVKVSMNSSGTPVVTALGDNSSEVIVSPKGGGTFKPGVYYYVTMIHNSSYTAGVTWTFYTSTKHATYKCKLSGDKPEYPSARSKFKVMDNKDHGLSWTDGGQVYTDALPGDFSVSATKKVRFSKGNLTYNVSTGVWDFFENQYDYATKYDSNLISLFTWGYGSWSTTPNTDHYLMYYISEQVAFPYSNDWGSAIVSKINWRTLSAEEWDYLLFTRTNASTLRKMKVTVCGKKNCTIIAPDNFAGTIATSYDEASWSAAEASGLVCLPPAGFRSGTTISFHGDQGYYWSSSPTRPYDWNNNYYTYALYVLFNSSYPEPEIDSYYPSSPISVRLVTDSN